MNRSARAMRWLGGALVILAALWLVGCAEPGGEADMITVVLDKAEADRAAVTVTEDLALIDVTSATGIGGLSATLNEGAWPAEIVIRLHMRGLERLEMRYGEFIITTGVSSNSGPPPALMLSVVGEDGTVQSASPSADIYYPTIRAIPAIGGTPAIPLPEDGAFEITLPRHFHVTGYPSFTMQWIDFYR